MTRDSGLSAPAADALRGLVEATLRAVAALETAARRLNPPALDALRTALGLVAERLESARAAWAACEPSPATAALEQAAELAAAALARFQASGSAEGVVALLASLRLHARAQAALFPLRRALPPVSAFFAEPALHGRLAALDPDPPPPGLSAGLHRGRGEGEDDRGGFALYVPEWLDPARRHPLVVALHGGFGCGRDFLWTWLREARSRGCLLLAPTSPGSTWSLDAPPRDAARLAAQVAYVAERWPVDRARVLLTGLSDGATMTLLAGLSDETPYSQLAPVSGVLHPLVFASGALARAQGRRIHLVHGALDWMFPVALARASRDALEQAGAEVHYEEIEDLSHTYPREVNARILDRFGARL